MKGKYKTPSGEIKEIHDFDAENKTVSVHKGSGQYEFHTESEYKDWKPVSENNVNTQGFEPEVVEQPAAHEPQKEKKDYTKSKNVPETHAKKPVKK